MGGKALKEVETRRLARSEYEAVTVQVSKVLREQLPGLWVDEVPAYRTKVDFGDLDLFVDDERLREAGAHLVHLFEPPLAPQHVADPGKAASDMFMDALVRRHFHATQTYQNGNVLSFNWRESALAPSGFQVDLVAMPRENYRYALDYYSFNDLGNLVGRVAAKMGLHHGHRGLTFQYMEGTHQFRDLVLTLDYDEALAFLGYDPVRFRQGFDTLEDVFAYVAGGRFFNADLFLLENRDAKSRVRDRKRTTYSGFLQWCAARPHLPKYPFHESAQDWTARFEAAFPGFASRYAQARQDYANWRVFKERFNGEKVTEWTGLKGLALASVMTHLRQGHASPEAFQQHVLESSESQLCKQAQQAAEAVAGERA